MGSLFYTSGCEVHKGVHLFFSGGNLVSDTCMICINKAKIIIADFNACNISRSMGCNIYIFPYFRSCIHFVCICVCMARIPHCGTQRVQAGSSTVRYPGPGSLSSCYIDTYIKLLGEKIRKVFKKFQATVTSTLIIS